MKKLSITIIFCFCIVLLLINTNKIEAVVFISEDWENFTSQGCWPCLEENCNINFNGWMSYAPVINTQAGISTKQKHSGIYSFYQYKLPNAPDACNIYHNIIGNPSVIHLRFYLYMGEDWTDEWANNINLVHWIFTNSARSGTGFRLNLVTHDYWDICPQGSVCMLPEGGPTSWWDWRTSPPWTAGIDFKSIIGSWHCFEYRIEIDPTDNNRVTLTEWVDGNLTRGPSKGPGSNTEYFYNIIFSGWDNAATSYNLDWYIDDIVVADSYIGCGESLLPDTTPPNQPTGALPI